MNFSHLSTLLSDSACLIYFCFYSINLSITLGEVITVSAKLNSVQQHCRIEQMKLEAELKEFKDKAKKQKDMQKYAQSLKL